MCQKINILVWALGTISAGEITLALRFCETLPQEEYEVCYILPKQYSNILPNNVKKVLLQPSDGRAKNKEIISKKIKKFKPNYMFVADPYTNSFASSWSGISFDEIKEYNIPVIGLDEYGYKNFKRKIDYYGGFNVRNRDYIEECDYAVQDVPVNLLNNGGIKNTFLYPIFSKENYKNSITESRRKSLKQKLGIDESRKMIVLPVSSWESVNINRIPILEGFTEKLIELVLFYLNELEKDVVLVHIGRQEIKYEDTQHVKYINFSSLDSAVYNECIEAADVYLSFNAVSVSLSKAILCNVPSILMINNKVLDFKKLQTTVKKLPSKYQELVNSIQVAYPYMASTFGWHKFLKPLIEKNKYFDTFLTCPIFSYSRMKESLLIALDKEGYKNIYGNKIEEYRDEIFKLNNSIEIMKKIREDGEYKNENSSKWF